MTDMIKMQTFGNIRVGIQNNDTEHWIVMIGEDVYFQARGAGMYFWELLREASNEYSPDGKAFEWIYNYVDRLNNDTALWSEFLGTNGRKLTVKMQSKEDKDIGPYVRVGFALD